MYYQQKELNLLLRAVQQNSCKERETFFVNVRSNRRRQQTAWHATPIAKLFTVPDEYHLLQFRATVARIRSMLMSKRMFLLDAFRAFDSDRNGLLGCSELYGGLEWLGIHLTPSQVQDVVRRFDTAGSGYITFDEFKAALADPENPERDPLLGGGGAHQTADGDYSGIVVAAKQMRELHEEEEMKKGADAGSVVQAAMLADISFSCVRPGSFEMVWSSKGSTARDKAATWVPVQSRSFFASMARPKEQVCLGHYCNVGFGKPKHSECERLTLEITDHGALGLTGSKRHHNVIKKMLPAPKLFRLVWSKPRAKRPIFVWEPVPPDPEYVALGMICTTSSVHPPTNSVRCVPRAWVTPAAMEPRPIWDDSGTAGRAGSLWIVNSLGLMAATEGHEAPEGPFFDLQCASFSSTIDLQLVPRQ